MIPRYTLAAVLAAVAAAATAAADGPPPPAKGKVTLPPLAEAQYADPKAAAAAADDIDKRYAGKAKPEAVRMLTDILRGRLMGGGDGWFGPARTRYTWDWLAARHGLAAGAKGIARAAFRGPADLFARLDRDGDGLIAPTDLDWSDKNPYVQQAALVTRFFRRMDADGDVKLTRADFDAFLKRAGGGKDYLTPDDLRAALLSSGPGGFLPGDGPTLAMLVKGLYSGELGSIQEGPGVGDAAPDFALKTIDGGETVTLSKLVGPKPVVLVFGNFTCGPFRAIFPEADTLYARYKDRATFLMVYVREAHPVDGWVMASNTKVGVAVKQPTTTAERAAVCAQFRDRLKPAMPVVVDDIADTAGDLYSAMPARFYVIDPAGKVAYQSGRGPFGFKAGEMEQALVMSLLEAAPQAPKAGAALPGNPPLPAWAEKTAAALPKTTARMLELDYLHRAENPLGNELAARVRLAVARELNSPYGIATATTDLGRADPDADADAAAVAFARKLTTAGHAITDAEFAAVLKQYGPERTTALVHTVAYANFHNRVVLGFGVVSRADPPVKVAFDAAQVAGIATPPRPPWDNVKSADHTGPRISPAWSARGPDALGAALAAQKDRGLRIPLPDKAKFAGLPDRERDQAERVVWTTVSTGYQPRMTKAWFACLGEFYGESQVNRVFTNSMFWVVTRTNDCFY